MTYIYSAVTLFLSLNNNQLHDKNVYYIYIYIYIYIYTYIYIYIYTYISMYQRFNKMCKKRVRVWDIQHEMRLTPIGFLASNMYVRV